MSKTTLTPRQQREREYYENFSNKLKNSKISFNYIDYQGNRPGNSYWDFYDIVFHQYSENKNKLLDFGCGAGGASIQFAKYGFQVSSFDNSPGMIKVAEHLAKQHDVFEQIDFTVQTAEKLDYPSGYFDIISGVDILHHIDIEQGIKECYRILKKGGQAIFREHIEIPVFDFVRNSKIGLKIIPKNKSAGHITEDERKLNKRDLLTIKKIFSSVELKRYLLLSRLDAFFSTSQYSPTPTLFEKVDCFLFKFLPISQKMGGAVVIILKK